MICNRCGDRVESPNATRAICYACYLDALVPVGYQGREAYTWCPVDKTYKAQARPATGVPVLDATRPVRVVDIVHLLTPAEIMAAGERERRHGVGEATE